MENDDLKDDQMGNSDENGAGNEKLLDFEAIQKTFSMPENQAAAHLGVSPASLKKSCRYCIVACVYMVSLKTHSRCVRLYAGHTTSSDGLIARSNRWQKRYANIHALAPRL
jgi:hypothetical protein